MSKGSEGELTTFCRNKSSLSHFNLLISCRKLSFWSLEVSSSMQREQERLLGVPAEDMDSRPVSESSLAVPLMKAPHDFPQEAEGGWLLPHWLLPLIDLSTGWWWLWWWWKWWWEAAEPSSSSLFSDESSLSEIRMLENRRRENPIVTIYHP